MAKTPSEDARKIKKSEDALWYADRSFINSPDGDGTPEDEKSGKRAKILNPKTAENIVKALSYLIGLSILGALIYAIYSFSENKRQKKFSSQSEEMDTENIETEEDLHKLDFLQKIKNTEDYRMVVRYYYLWLLQDLSKGGLIKFEKNKTNRQYAEELRNHKKASDFNVCTRYYNFVWYGEYAVSTELYAEIVSKFKKLLPHA
jgi:hypothetical protein